MEITIKIDKRKKEAVAFLAFIKSLSFIEVEMYEGEYDPKFVEMVKKSASSKKRILVKNVNDLWESL